jgi:hypothetical protein
MRYIGGVKPDDRKLFKAVSSAYEPTAYNNVNGFQNIYDGKTIDAFLNEQNKEIIVGIRGTTLNVNDLVADVKLVGNNLSNSDRYRQDLIQMREIMNRYPPNIYKYYLSGHSLGGAVVKQLKRDFRQLNEATTFNSASQPKDLVNQDPTILDKYIDKDALYNTTGRFIKNKVVYPYKAKPTKGMFGWLKQKATPTFINAHKLEQFDFLGRGKNVYDNLETLDDLYNYYKTDINGSDNFIESIENLQGGVIYSKKIGNNPIDVIDNMIIFNKGVVDSNNPKKSAYDIITIRTKNDEDMKKFIKMYKSKYKFSGEPDIEKGKTGNKDLDVVAGFEWYCMPRFNPSKNIFDLVEVKILYSKANNPEIKEFFDKNKNQFILSTRGIYWYPERDETYRANANTKMWISEDNYKPKYPIYVLSKGRQTRRTTVRYLDWCGIDYKIVIEENEKEEYIKNGHKPDKILTFDRNKSIEQMKKSNKNEVPTGGGIPARNFIMKHAYDNNKKGKHWILDDNIEGWFRMENSERVLCKGGFIFRIVEDYVDRYENIKMAGHQYFSFAIEKTVGLAPIIKNTRVFSSILLSNNLLDEKDEYGPIRWRGQYNEDIDLSIRILKQGLKNMENKTDNSKWFATCLFNNILANKQRTLTSPGGNAEIYGYSNIKPSGKSAQQSEEVKKSKQAKVNQLLFWYPEYSGVSEKGKASLSNRIKKPILKGTERYGRPHHTMNFNMFKDIPFIWKSEKLKETLIQMSTTPNAKCDYKKIQKLL